MTDDTYQGWPNRETWAFNLHWQNDQGLYNETLEQATSVSDEAGNSELGEHIVNYWKNFLDDYEEDFGSPLPEGLVMFRNEVGSWWRVDYASVGEAVRENLETEGS